MMFEGYRKTNFMDALRQWDELDKKVICYHHQKVHEFKTDTNWRTDFKVNASMILEGEWFVKN